MESYQINVNFVKTGVLDEQVKNLWNLERGDEVTEAMSREDLEVMELWEDSTEVKQGRYVVPIPFKPGQPDFPDNRAAAVKRLT